jgi:ABC-2 type transport system permease protein
VGKAIPTLLIGVANSLTLMGLVTLWFDVPIRGSLFLMTLLTVPFLLAQIGWGTLISLVSRTQQQAMLLVFALAMLEVAFSGFMVPAGEMPGVMQAFSYGSSVQHYLVVLRGVMLRGAGLSLLWTRASLLVGISALVATAAWLRLGLGLDADSFRQRLARWWRDAVQRWCQAWPRICSRTLRRRGTTKPDWSSELA